MAMLPVGDSGGSSDQSGNTGGSGGNGRRPRQHLIPKSMEDILKFAVENSSPGEQPQEAMSDERKRWLGQALSGMFTDEVKILQEKLAELAAVANSETEEDGKRKESLLENVTDLCDTIDNARDFIKVGGHKVVFPCFKDSRSEVRWRALEVAGTVLQNNPFVQESLLKEDAMGTFMEMADEDRSDLVRIKAIFALSCHVREHDPSGRAFVKADGFSCLMRAMQSTNEKLQIKSAFLLKALLISQPEFKDGAQHIGMVPQLIGLLNTEHTAAHEHLVAALLCLVTDHPASIADCRQPRLRLQEFLGARMALTEDKEEFEEEYQYCHELSKIVFTSSDNQAPADR